MRIISVRQPWASLIVSGGTNVQTGATELKDVENRAWATMYRGPVLIHASQRTDGIAAGDIERRFGVRVPPDQPLGGIVGVTEIVDCVPSHPSRWHVPGHFAFVLANSRPLPFVRWRGALSLRAAPAELLELCALSIAKDNPSDTLAANAALEPL